VYDYGALASSADFVSVMSYDDPDSTGPISPYPWLKKVITYSLKYIPAKKLSLGLPLYYWKWDIASGKVVSVGGYVGIQNTLKRKKITIGYSTANQAPYIKYAVKKERYILWYENSKSIAEKINLIKKYKLQGFSAWLLGLETPSIYSALK
jgi:spore germination protein YaaH